MSGLNLRFPDEGWERIERDWSAWWAGELDRPMVVLECIERLDAYDPHCASTFLPNYPFERPAAEILADFEPRLESTHYLGDSFPRFWPNFGPGILAAVAGAQVQPAWDTTWFVPVGSGPLSELKVAFDEDQPWWRRVEEFSAAAIERWGNSLAVGFTDLGGNLDVLASLRGSQQLLTDLVDEPEQVDRLAAEISRAWLEAFGRLEARLAAAGRGFTCWGPLWSRQAGYMLQSDLSYMISPRMFGRFVLPDLQACCARMEHAFYHLDGKGEIPHLDQLLAIGRLRGIQWVPGDGNPPAEAWLPLLDRIRKAGKLCQVTVSPQGALTIRRELGGKGFCFLVGEPQLTPEQGRAFLEALRTS